MFVDNLLKSSGTPLLEQLLQFTSAQFRRSELELMDRLSLG